MIYLTPSKIIIKCTIYNEKLAFLNKKVKKESIYISKKLFVKKENKTSIKVSVNETLGLIFEI